MIRDNIHRIQEEIASICQKIGRNPQDINLIGVTKYSDSESIKEAAQSGLIHLAENKVQEAQIKFAVLNDLDINVLKHMIGHLQTNKVKDALRIFDMIQSVDSKKLALEIERQAQKQDRKVDILIQVNTSMEKQRFGVSQNEALALIEEMTKCEHIHIQGLMTIATLTDDRDVIRGCFQKLRLLSEKISKQISGHERVTMKYLSMGMTADYDIALEEGANMIRIGRAIFKNE